MEKLNEVKQAFYGVIQGGKVVMLPAEDGQWLNKTSVAEAFQALEKEAQKNLEGAFAWQNRAEAAEAALAEMEKQKPVAYLTWHQGFRSPDDCEDYLVVASNGDNSCDGSKAFPVFNRPAPAADLAELVPDEVTVLLVHLEDILPDAAFNLIDVKLWNAVSALSRPDVYRAAILRNIEEAK